MNISRFFKIKKGFVVLFAVILVSIILTISLSLFNITFKQLYLSSVVKESQHAFYFADSAARCARYWGAFYNSSCFYDTNPANCGPFGFPSIDSNGNPIFHQPSLNTVNCFGGDLDLTVSPQQTRTCDLNSCSTSFKVSLTDSDGRSSCVDMTVLANINNTKIQADGYNNANCTSASGRTVLRSVNLGF